MVTVFNSFVPNDQLREKAAQLANKLFLVHMHFLQGSGFGQSKVSDHATLKILPKEAHMRTASGPRRGSLTGHVVFL